MSPPASTRRAIIDLLKTEGALTPADLADRLGITTVAVRQHLGDLATEKVAETVAAGIGGERKRGRPAVAWRLTDAADSFFPDGHEELAVGLIHGLRAAFGEDGINRLIAQRTEAQVKAYGKAIGGGETLTERLEKLAAARTREGYMAEVEGDADGYLFVEHHCPICAAAKVCTGLCASELEVFRRALGDGVTVERTDHLLAGANRCAYRVRARS
ncbi:MAG: transcriptional regulator [Rhodospirillales bacterium]